MFNFLKFHLKKSQSIHNEKNLNKWKCSKVQKKIECSNYLNARKIQKYEKKGKNKRKTN